MKEVLTFKPKLCEKSLELAAQRHIRDSSLTVLQVSTQKGSPEKRNNLLDMRKQVKFNRQSSQTRSTGHLIQINSDLQSKRHNFSYAPILSQSKSKKVLSQKRMSFAEKCTPMKEEEEVYSTQ